MKSRNKKRLLALVLCMVVAISNSSFIFASETGQAEYPQEAEVQTQDEAVANDMDVAAYAADEDQAVADEQPATVEQVAAEPAAEPETTVETQEAQPVAEAPAAEQPTTEAPAAETPAAQEPAAAPTVFDIFFFFQCRNSCCLCHHGNIPWLCGHRHFFK